MRAFVVNLVGVLELRPESQNFALAYVILMLVWNYYRDYRTRVRRFSDVFTGMILFSLHIPLNFQDALRRQFARSTANRGNKAMEQFER